ncbi:MAG TPA: NAD-dependent epimerase/dehydratase family protein [Nitrososphaerales archaeon]|nr:NAD-dependent epimerase/dehydratase family protein [Nitrososphaerales archaeon]
MKEKVLVTGSAGQIGCELVPALRTRLGKENVVAGTYRKGFPDDGDSGPSAEVDVTRREDVARTIKQHGVDTVYHLAAVISAVGERDPQTAWSVNMEGLKNVLDASRENGVRRVYWASSAAVFGPDAPKKMAPQDAPLNPTTIYGVTKVAGELLCNYYFLKYGFDIRSIRYPGIISNKAMPGGGTTDYAVEIFYAAIQKGSYQCYLRQDTALPMMYMPDCIRATLMIMDAPLESVPRHAGYNLSGMSFTPGELAAEIRRRLPDFACTYSPDGRQKIADSWPGSIDDKEARRDWGWRPTIGLAAMTDDMLSSLSERLSGSRAS